MQKSNPEIQQIFIPRTPTVTLQRKWQSAITDIRSAYGDADGYRLPTIAKSHYEGSADPYPSTLTATKFMKGGGFRIRMAAGIKERIRLYAPLPGTSGCAGYPNGFETNVIADTDGDLELLK